MAMATPLHSDVFDAHPTFNLDVDDDVSPVCKYVDIKDISVCINSKQFSLLLFNIRSCRKNFNEFECVFSEYFRHFSFIAVTETWLT